MDLVGRTGIKLHIPRQCDHICARLFKRFAHIQRFQLSHCINMLKNLLPDARQNAPTFKVRQLAPIANKRILCRLHRTINVRRIPLGDAAQHTAIRGVAQIEDLTACRRHPTPPYEAKRRIDPKRAKCHGLSFQLAPQDRRCFARFKQYAHARAGPHPQDALTPLRLANRCRTGIRCRLCPILHRRHRPLQRGSRRPIHLYARPAHCHQPASHLAYETMHR